MSVEIIMPKFGLSMEEGTLAAWLVQEGDTVTSGQPVAEVASEKLTNEAVAPAGGRVEKLMAEEGDTLPCGAPIALLAADGETEPPPAPVAESKPAAAKPAPPPPPVEPPTAPVKPAPAAGGITPRAKKVAQAQGIAYEHIRGTGLLGLITLEDLRREGKPRQAAPPPAPPAVTAGKTCLLDPMQKAIARGMHSSMTNAAQTTLATEANMRGAVRVYEGLKEKYAAAGIKLSYTAMLIKAVAMALEGHPQMRMRLVDEAHYTVVEAVDIGVAVDVPGGLVVPVVRGVNLKDLRAICLDLADLVGRARGQSLREEDLGGAAMTVTNLGMYGVTYFTPILNEPEPCILGAGAILQKPVARDGGVFVDSVMNLSLTHDHRIINGAPAARFLQAVCANLDEFAWT